MAAQAQARRGEVQGAAPAEPAAPVRAAPPVLRGTPRLKLSWSDRWALLGDAKGLMASIFLGIFGLSIFAAILAKPEYEASARLLVGPPSDSSAARASDPETRAKGEVALLRSPTVAARVVGAFGVRRLFPGVETGGAAGRAEAMREFDTRLKITVAPESGIIRVALRAPEPRLSVLALDRLLVSYGEYRRATPSLPDSAPLADQRRDFEQRLAQADSALRAFLAARGVSDFPSERAAAAGLASSLTHDVAEGGAYLAEAEARLRAIHTSLGGMAAGDPLRPALQLDETRLTGDLAAQKRRLATLQRSLTNANKRLAALRTLAPEYDRLLRARETLADAARRYADREEDARAERAMRLSATSDVRVLDRSGPVIVGGAVAPSVLAAGFAAALLLAVAAGLWRTARARRFPTAQAAARNLGMPALAVIPRARRRKGGRK
jgi:uncharacterized protein involved in exopolysaccharide biosynthesis